jgi:hypothetical protein
MMEAFRKYPWRDEDFPPPPIPLTSEVKSGTMRLSDTDGCCGGSILHGDMAGSKEETRDWYNAIRNDERHMYEPYRAFHIAIVPPGSEAEKFFIEIGYTKFLDFGGQSFYAIEGQHTKDENVVIKGVY